MGQMSAVNRLPENLRNKVIEMVNNPAMTQLDIVNAINDEAGKQVLSHSSINRFVLGMEKLSGTKRGLNPPSIEESLGRTAKALERIAYFLENQYKKTS